MRKICAVLSFLVAAQPVLAEEYNPFLGRASKEKPAVKEKVATAKVPAPPIATPLLPPPAVPAPPVPVGGLRPEARQGGTLEKAPELKPFTITGRIGDLVSITERTGSRAVIQDGTLRNGCFVLYPNVICDKTEIAQAKREYAEAKMKEAQPAAETPEVKAKEDAAALTKVRSDLAVASEGLAKSKAELAAIKAEAASAKARADVLGRQISGLKQANSKLSDDNTELARQLVDASEAGVGKQAQLEELRRQLSRISQENKRLLATNAELAKSAAEAAKAETVVVDLQKKLTDSLARGAKAEKDLADLRAAMAAPPAWVKGTAKHYSDPNLGEVIVSRTEKQVFFRVARSGEDPADKLFGSTVVRKERKGDYTYYALNAHNVRVKEQ